MLATKRLGTTLLAPPRARSLERCNVARDGLLRALLALSLGGCGSNPYGYARTYSPTAAEARAVGGAEEFDPVMARRRPELWSKKQVSLFGVVLARRDGLDGSLDLDVSLRALQAKNLCANAREDSCRTTVSEDELGRLTVRLVGVTCPERGGETCDGYAIQVGSLLRVVGALQSSPERMVIGSFSRHWPRGAYVTTAAAVSRQR